MKLNSDYNSPTFCVIIPTYNNHKTLKRVLDGVLIYTQNIIVVNDGSTDTTSQILSEYSSLEVITLEKNSGKGVALQAGFKKAQLLGFDYAITIDSDGQHYPSDLPVFIDEIKKSEHPVLLIGSRNMAHDSVPKKSSFGNKFSNFWFKFETGIELSDTQSGFRAYPLKFLPKKFYSSKFEFEIEIIVRLAWNGIELKNIPIQVLYDPAERVSHFRPFRDFTRISIVNTVLVTMLFLYIKPRDFFRSFKKKSFKKFITEDVLSVNDSPEKKALSIALGSFIGFSPLWGFHTALAISLAVFFKLNKVLAFTFSNVSFPPFIPFIIYGSLQLGSFFIANPVEVLNFDSLTLSSIPNHLIQYIIGSFLLAILGSLSLGIFSYMYFKLKQNKQQ